jgi:hypothetical protein
MIRETRSEGPKFRKIFFFFCKSLFRLMKYMLCIFLKKDQREARRTCGSGGRDGEALPFIGSGRRWSDCEGSHDVEL